MSQIKTTFQHLQTAGRTALMPYLTMGYPELDSALTLVPAIAEAGADLDYIIAGRNVGGGRDLRQYLGVDQEVLPQALACPQAVTPQQFPRHRLQRSRAGWAVVVGNRHVSHRGGRAPFIDPARRLARTVQLRPGTPAAPRVIHLPLLPFGSDGIS